SPVLRDACSPDEAKRNPGLAFQKANPPLGLHNRRRSLHPGYVLLSKDAAFPQLLQVPCRSEARLTSSPSRSSSSRAPTRRGRRRLSAPWRLASRLRSSPF